MLLSSRFTIIFLSFLWNTISYLGISQKIWNTISRGVPLPSTAVRQTHFLVRHAVLSMHKLCSWGRSAQGVKPLPWNEPQEVLGEPWEGGSTAHGNSHPSQSSLGKPQWTPTEAVRAAKLMPCSNLHTNTAGGWVPVLQRKKVPNSVFSWPSNWQEPRGENISENCGTTDWDQRLNKLVCLPLTCVNNAGFKQKAAISENPKPGWQDHWKSTCCKFSWDREPERDTVMKIGNNDSLLEPLDLETLGLATTTTFFSLKKSRNCQDFSKKFSRYT